jgi:hypothetical protein
MERIYLPIPFLFYTPPSAPAFFVWLKKKRIHKNPLSHKTPKGTPKSQTQHNTPN